MCVYLLVTTHLAILLIFLLQSYSNNNKLLGVFYILISTIFVGEKALFRSYGVIYKWQYPLVFLQ